VSSATQPYLVGMEAEQRRLDLSQWYTPASIAIPLWRWANARPVDRVLEPTAGRGALLAPVLRQEPREVVAYEIDPTNVQALERMQSEHRARAGWSFELRAGDFLAAHDPGYFELGLLNTPFEDNQECIFAERALRCCDRVVGVFRSAMLHADGRRDFWSRVQPTRIAYLLSRPQFGTSQSSDGARSDFVVMELRLRAKGQREMPIGPIGATRCSVEFW
jgi:predicted RNA methylase